MARPDWLKIDEISHLWAEETGRDASSLQTDLEGWFAEFTKESSISRQLVADAPFDTIVANRLLGMLGARYLERRTFEFYCQERGLSKPRFWSHGQDAGPTSSPPRRQPIEPAVGAEAEVLALKAQLEAAQQNVAALRAENLANRRSWPDLQTPRPRRTRRSRVVLAAGLAVPLVALLAWGTETLIRRAGNEPIAQASETAPAPPDSVPTGNSGNILELGSGQAAAPESPESAESSAGEAQAEAERLRADNTHLMDQLAQARAAVESLREAQRQAGETSGTGAQQADSAATDSSVEVAVLETQLMSARRQIADLEKALEVATRQRGATASQPSDASQTSAQSDPVSAADQAAPEKADGTAYGAEIAEVLTGAELASEPTKTQTVALFDVVSSDDLLLDPDHYLGRQVVVTGSVMWLLRRYWLRSDNGQESMVIDVNGLKPDDRYELENAVVNIETLAQVRARITGTIERRGSDSYRLAASELMLAK